MSEPCASIPPNMSPGHKAFEMLNIVASEGCGARLARLALPGRKMIETPNFTAMTSRGAVPHITPDNMRKHTTSGSVYMALEDFIERKQPPIFKTPPGPQRTLHSFTALPSNIITILAARRCPAVTTPAGNSTKSVTIFTSTGFRSVTVPEYAAAVDLLQPDIAIPLADLLHTSLTPPSKKLIRMAERTEEWSERFFANWQANDRTNMPATSMFAPILAIEHPFQWTYLKYLANDAINSISGLALYDVKILQELAAYPTLTTLPRLSLDPATTPHDILEQISLGVDICVLPFINTISDAGIAMSFTFPPPETTTSAQPLGTNMWLPEHTMSLEPLSSKCTCHSCTNYKRSYIQHLLNAKEMLGWSLLQVHNHAVIGDFFQGIRETLAQGQAAFVKAKTAFLATYETTFPAGTGERPRARGYHFKSEGGDDQINPTTWRELQGQKDGAKEESATNV